MSFKFICPLFQGFNIVKLNSLPFPLACKMLAKVKTFNYNVKNDQFPQGLPMEMSHVDMKIAKSYDSANN